MGFNLGFKGLILFHFNFSHFKKPTSLATYYTKNVSCLLCYKGCNLQINNA